MEDVIKPDIKMIEWDFDKKISYLKQKKELLYEAWWQKLQSTPNIKFEKTNKDAFYHFYNAITSFAKVLLVSNYDENMPQVIKFQQETEQEVESFLAYPKILENRCEKHSLALKQKVTQIINDHTAFDEFFKNELNTIRMLYIYPETNENRYLWLRIGYKCEAFLFNKDSIYQNTEQARTFGNKFIKDFDDMLLPVRKFKSIEKRQNSQSSNEISHPKYYYIFQNLVAAHPEYEKYRTEFFALSERIRIWTMMFEDKRYTYYRHYDSFQKAINTDIKLRTWDTPLPKPVLNSLYRYAVIRFEKMEVFKKISSNVVSTDIKTLQTNYRDYLLDWTKQIGELQKQHDFSPELKNDIMSMYYIQASFFTKKKLECDYYMDKISKTIHCPTANSDEYFSAPKAKYLISSQVCSIEK